MGDKKPINTLSLPLGSFREIDMFVEHTCDDFGMDKKRVRTHLRH
jgi:hypothetical protein